MSSTDFSADTLSFLITFSFANLATHPMFMLISFVHELRVGKLNVPQKVRLFFDGIPVMTQPVQVTAQEVMRLWKHLSVERILIDDIT